MQQHDEDLGLVGFQLDPNYQLPNMAEELKETSLDGKKALSFL